MSDPNPSPPALGLVSANMIDEWSYLLSGPERSAFVKAHERMHRSGGRRGPSPVYTHPLFLDVEDDSDGRRPEQASDARHSQVRANAMLR